MRTPDPIRDKLILPVAFAVTTGWIVSLFYGIVTAKYTPLTVTTPLMLILAGYAFGVGIVRSAEKG